MRWTVVIPAKALPEAKSRLLGASADPAAHRRLVRAIRADTLAAACATAAVARVLVVTDGAGGLDAAPQPRAPMATPVAVHTLVQSEPGLNAALREAAAHAAGSWPDDGIVALVGDLPALRPDELAAALAAAAGHRRSFVPDAPGTGTTLLAVIPGTALEPGFGVGSAARHAAGAAVLAAGEGLRHDVDTAADLQAARALALGPATAAVLADAEVAVRSP